MAAPTDVTLLNLLKKWYSNRTVDRAVWTLAEVGVGVAATHLSGYTYAGISAASGLFVVKEFVATKLAAVGGPITLPPGTVSTVP